MWKEGRGFRDNKLPFLTFSADVEGGREGQEGGGGKKERGKKDGDARQGQTLTAGFVVEVQGFHYQSVGPLGTTRQEIKGMLVEGRSLSSHCAGKHRCQRYH